MAIRLRINGVPIKCDTAEEATAILAATTKQAAPEPKKAAASAVPEKRPTVSLGADFNAKFALLWHVADEEGRQLLRLAAGTDGPLYVSDLPEKLGVDPKRSNWIRRKMAEAAAEKGVDIEQFLQQTRLNIDGKPKTAYRATKLLRDGIQSKPQDN